MKKAILLDFDGTIVEDIISIENIFFSLLKMMPLKKKIKFSDYNGPPIDVIIKKIIKDQNLDIEPSKYIRIYRQIYSTFLKNYQLSNDFLEFLKFYSNNGVLFGVVSSNSKKIIIQFLKNKNIYEYFKFIIGFEDCDQFKPSSYPYRLIKSKFKLSNFHLISIEDSENGKLSSLGAGIRCEIYTKNNNFKKINYKLRRSFFYKC